MLFGLLVLERAVSLSQLSRPDSKRTKKTPFPRPIALTNQHGENYILVEEMNKSWMNVAGEVRGKRPSVSAAAQWCGSCAGEKGKPHKRRFVLAQGRWGARESQGEGTKLESACEFRSVITVMLNLTVGSCALCCRVDVSWSPWIPVFLW